MWRVNEHITTPPTPPAAGTPERRVRSFVLRAGRTTTAQARALQTLGPRYVLPFRPEPIDATALFGRAAPLILEIGFGMGEATAHIAHERAQDNFLCCEVHPPGVGALLRRIEAMGLNNIRIIQHDAVEVLQHMLPPWRPEQPELGLAGVHIFFPDPWPKKRHHKRRLIQPPLVALLASRLRPGGYVHCATDWQPYAEQMLQVLSAEPLLRNTSTDPALGGYAPRPDYRPPTKFEQRGLRLGHGVWDLIFERRDG
jgi:tRNA (guanine-N7-)-methyltransferase